MVNKGITEKQIRQLIHFANTDPDVIKFTSDPERFKDREAFEAWKKKERTVYTLTSSKGDLLGIVWFGKEPIPQREFIQEFSKENYQITFGIRIYGAARGKGLAHSFMQEAFNNFETGGKGIWLETSSDNVPAVKAYGRFGFKQITEADAQGKILMILPVTRH